ncbi:MAG: O-antigen ligase family protein [Prevotella sp.]|nr:O-antigen ligase family protein [Prevotella sp.]
MGIIICALICLWALRNFKNAVIFTGIVIQAMPHLGTGIPGVRIFPALVIALLLIYFFLKKKIFSSTSPNLCFPRPIIVSIIFISLCYITTYFVVKQGNFALTIINLIVYFAFPILFLRCLDTQKAMNFLWKVLITFFTVAVFFAFLEQILRHNYFYDVMESLFSFDMWSMDSSEIRYGLKRCNSIFAQSGHMALHSILAFTAFFYLKYFFNYRIKSRLLFFLICTLPILVLFSGSRALFVGFAFIVLCLPLRSFFKKKSSYLIAVFLFIVLLVSIPYLSHILDTIINSNKGGGSSTDMREWQWDICMLYFNQSPWWGNGRMYIWDVVSVENPLLLGAESIWFSLIVEYGIMGCVSYLFFIICSSFAMATHTYKNLFFLPIAYLVITTFSTALGIEFNVPLTYMAILIALFRKCQNVQIRKVNASY